MEASPEAAVSTRTNMLPIKVSAWHRDEDARGIEPFPVQFSSLPSHVTPVSFATIGTTIRKGELFTTANYKQEERVNIETLSFVVVHI